MFIQKRGQTTIFIIVGLVIVIIIALFFFIRGNIGAVGEQVPFATKTNEIQEFTQNCIDQTVKSGLKTISARAGYYTFPENTFEQGGNKYVYVYYGENKYYLGEQDVIENIKSYVKDNLDECIGNYKSLGGLGYSVSKNGDTEVDVTLGDLTVVDVNYPVLIKKGEEQSSLFDFNAITANDGLKRNLNSVKQIVDEYAEFGLTPGKGESNCDQVVETEYDLGGFCWWKSTDGDVDYRFIFVIE